MSETENTTSNFEVQISMPGAYLKSQREKRSLTREYVATKLHLREQVVDLLEQDQYNDMPESVFVKGYIRAYAKLLDVPFEPLIDTYNSLFPQQPTPEKVVWQGKRQKNKAEHAIRWMTGILALGVVLTVAVWWSKSLETTQHISTETEQITAEASKPVKVTQTDVKQLNQMLSVDSDFSTADTSNEQ